MLINTDLETFKYSNNKITGVVYISYDNLFFPEKDWNDFVSIISSWWVQNALKMINELEYNYEFCFMDGPFSFKVFSDINYVNIYFFKNQIEIHNLILTKQNFLVEIYDFGSKVINKCEIENWSNSDIGKLKNNLILLGAKLL